MIVLTFLTVKCGSGLTRRSPAGDGVEFDEFAVVDARFTGDFVITLVAMLGKFNESKNGVRADIMDNSFESIGFRLALGP